MLMKKTQKLLRYCTEKSAPGNFNNAAEMLSVMGTATASTKKRLGPLSFEILAVHRMDRQTATATVSLRHQKPVLQADETPDDGFFKCNSAITHVNTTAEPEFRAEIGTQTLLKLLSMQKSAIQELDNNDLKSLLIAVHYFDATIVATRERMSTGLLRSVFTAVLE
eukprot:984936_1